jgi:hypothetical protein
MSFSDLASLGSFVSGIAVVISFVFLGLQIRQADRNQRAVLNAQTASMMSEHMLRLTEPHLAEPYSRMMEGGTDFTPTEFLQLMGIVTALLGDYEDIDTRRRLGLADAEGAEGAKKGLSNLLSFPFTRALWSMGETTFTPSFRAHVNAIIRDVPAQPPGSYISAFKANLDAQLKQSGS